jgi:hypothetical protein
MKLVVIDYRSIRKLKFRNLNTPDVIDHSVANKAEQTNAGAVRRDFTKAMTSAIQAS